MAATYNFPEHVNKDTFDGKTFTITENGTPIDLVGATINIDLKIAKDSTTYAKRFSTASSPPEITIPASPAGTFIFSEQDINVTPRKYFHDIEILFASGRRKTWIKGRWNITQESN